MKVLESDNQLKTRDMEEGKKKRFRPTVSMYRELERTVLYLKGLNEKLGNSSNEAE